MDIWILVHQYPPGNYMYKVNNRNTGTMCETIVNFEQVNADRVFGLL